jgi:hypothetical protein
VTVAADRSGTVRAGVRVGGAAMPLRPDVERQLVRVVVDTHVHLPDMFELTFFDEAGDLLGQAGLTIGTPVEVHGGAVESRDATKLIAGEVTSIEAVCAELNVYTVVRGYEQAHRLQRARRTRTFVNTSDSEAVRKVAQDAKVRIGKIDSTATTHDHLAQVAQTDWDFIKQRAREAGYETGVLNGELFFRKPPGMPSSGARGPGQAEAHLQGQPADLPAAGHRGQPHQRGGGAVLGPGRGQGRLPHDEDPIRYGGPVPETR